MIITLCTLCKIHSAVQVYVNINVSSGPLVNLQLETSLGGSATGF